MGDFFLKIKYFLVFLVCGNSHSLTYPACATDTAGKGSSTTGTESTAVTKGASEASRKEENRKTEAADSDSSRRRSQSRRSKTLKRESTFKLINYVGKCFFFLFYTKNLRPWMVVSRKNSLDLLAAEVRDIFLCWKLVVVALAIAGAALRCQRLHISRTPSFP